MTTATHKKHRYINLKSEVHDQLDEIRRERSKELGVELSWSEFLSNTFVEYLRMAAREKAAGGKPKK